MLLRWDGDRPLADREAIACLYEVSERTVRRHCRPVRYQPRTGQARGEGGTALYDAFAAADDLAAVAPRPARAAQRLRARFHLPAA